MARTTAADPPSLPSSSSIASFASTLAPSSSGHSLSSNATYSVMSHKDPTPTTARLRSNSTTLTQLSPTDSRHTGPLAQAQAQALGPSSSVLPGGLLPAAPPISPRVSEHHFTATTPPPRPPRGPLRSPGAPRSPVVYSVPTMPSQPAVPNPGGAHSDVSPRIRLIMRALEHSKDGGETLDVSRDKLDRIGDEEVEWFRSKVGKEHRGVWRLALSYNHLRDGSIVSSFATLHRLRYLNLKGNKLTVVPPALTQLPALEILDLSKNQIVTMPESPGRLAHLKVLSLSDNRLTALPAYLCTFHHLKVFKVDHNPIMWPPPEVLGPLIEPPPSRPRGDAGDRKSKRTEDDLKEWIDRMKMWLQAQTEQGEQMLERAFERTRAAEDPGDEHTPKETTSEVTPGEHGYAVEQVSVAYNLYAPGPLTVEPETVPSDTDTAVNATIEIDAGTVKKITDEEPPIEILSGNVSTEVSDDSIIRPSTSTLSLPSQALRHDPSLSHSSTPPASASTTSSSHSGQLPSITKTLPSVHSIPHGNGHNRGASYTVTQRMSGTLTAKKSLPDLRQSHAKIIEERRGEATDELRPLGMGIGPRSANWQFKLQPSLLEEKRTVQKMTSIDVLQTAKPATAAVVDRRDSQDGPAIDESRNSYFRRLSMLPPSTISKAVSPAMLMFVDAIRGLLFAMTQLHAALRQYLNFAVTDRVAGVFSRVLEPAGRYTTNLINALDRFDSTSRRSAPPVAAVRGVVDAAKESIAVFGKIVAVLRLQTPAFREADVRYTRQLLLNIYGGMAEIACSWRTMSALLVEMRPLLATEGTRLAPPMSKSSSLGGRKPISPILERGESLERPTRLAAAATPRVGSSPRTKSRRHAGSFSVQDVERGMHMGSPSATKTEWPDLGRAIPEAGETLPPFPLHAEPEPPAQTPPMASSFSQPPASRHIPTSSAGSSYLNGNASHRADLSFDIRPPTPASATLFDEDLLDVIETATDIAFTVWLRLAEDIGASGPPSFPPSHGKSDSVDSAASTSASTRIGRPPTIPSKAYHELVTWLSTAEQVTTTLRESLMGLRANPFAFSHSALPDHTASFIKTVVQVSGLIKALSAGHSFSTGVRQSLSKLTQATRECAILIQVSSLRPSNGTPTPDHASSMHGHSVHGHQSGIVGGAGAGSGGAGVGGGGGVMGGEYPPPAQTGSAEDLTPSAGLRGLHLPTRAARRRQGYNSPPSEGNRFMPMKVKR